MRNKEHIGFAIFIGIGIYFVLIVLNLEELFAYTIPMYLTTVLPDILEPAIHYTHRNFFHSKRVLRFLYKYALWISLVIAIFFNGFFYIFFGILGYILHLLLDSTTPMGLPE